MKLKQVTIDNFRAIEHLELPLDSRLTVLLGNNGQGKTSVLSAIAVGLGSIARYLPGVSSVGFLKPDQRWQLPIRVELTTTDGISWERWSGAKGRNVGGLRHLKEAICRIVDADQNGNDPIDLPVVAFYQTDRAVFDVPQSNRNLGRSFTRYGALEGALSARTNFHHLFQWFYTKENEELREQRELGDFEYRLKELDAVRRAIEGMVPGVSRPRIASRPLRFVVTTSPELGDLRVTDLNQLSGGYRIILAVAADLARRMAQGNPHLDDPLLSEAIVLLDEIELHLHPAWQQLVLEDLIRTFPNVQFIVATHSPQVLTTVKPEHIVELRYYADGIRASRATGPTFGAEAGYVLDTVMGVTERPPGNEFVTDLEQYRQLVNDGLGESELALDIRRKLENLSPRDPALDRADIEIRRNRVLNDIGQ